MPRNRRQSRPALAPKAQRSRQQHCAQHNARSGWHAVAAFTWQVTLAALGISLLCSAAAYLIYFRLVADVGPTKTFTVTFLIPVFGTLWGALFLNEPVGLSTLAGGAVIVIATALVLEVGKRRATRSGARDLSG